MSYLMAIFYGFIQGVAEFLPISSSGHLAALHNVFDIADLEGSASLLFDILLHLGTLAAVVIVYYKDIWELILAFFRIVKKVFSGKCRYSEFDRNERFVILLFVAVIPLVIGAFIDGYVEAVRNYTFAIGIFWLINGVMLLVSDGIVKKKKSLEEITPKNAFCVGLFQLIAILPGISRSGMTITGGLFNGFKREEAVKFSFILSIPAILGANVFAIASLSSEAFASINVGVYAVGIVSAAVFGVLAIKLLNYISQKHNFRLFSVYCFVIGVAAIAYDIIKALI